MSLDPNSIYIVIGYYAIKLEERLTFPPPNTINPERRGHYLVPILSVLLSVSTLATVLRTYTRVFVVRKFGHDDILIIPAYLAALILTIAEIISLDAGWGLHVWDFRLEDARKLTISGYTVQTCMAACCLLTKLSILISYLRFAPSGLRFWAMVTIGFVTLWTLGLMIPLILSCFPPHLYWDTYFRTPGMKCFSPFTIRILQYTTCSLNILTDIIVLFLPIPTIWNLHMPTRQKWSCVLVFALWTVATIAAVLRLWKTITAFEAFDASWYGYDLWVYVALEAHLAVVCACAPGIKPLITRIWPKFDKFHPSVGQNMTPPARGRISRRRGEPTSVFEIIKSGGKLFSKSSSGKWNSTNNDTLNSAILDEEQARGHELQVQTRLKPTHSRGSSRAELRPKDIAETSHNDQPNSGNSSDSRESMELPLQQFSLAGSQEQLPTETYSSSSAAGDRSPADTFGRPSAIEITRTTQVTVESQQFRGALKPKSGGWI
ncbi:hypothetical protein H072_6447 [Dactylellina haptotyla CBS 200.50]|uniref:Rhodopsin domain-containing protein n=1 Tax=Dactylellina haptotyla (strain CBS 200.50) TaxID=1284197 RepID=S8BWR4_DACHA|nr:hypothetical protein H072_6447 [Dactylellina haptotyla CBS 200.50]